MLNSRNFLFYMFSFIPKGINPVQFNCQVDYILGQNPARTSYMVGFGNRYPLHVHHRGSSLPATRDHPGRISCNDGFQYLYSRSPNPNLLVGAIVGGPDSGDGFSDDRNNYRQSEPATYINAPFVGALAFFAANPNIWHDEMMN